jgi:uncharacterized protein with NAD-binding domain and iron-sulfur cluster
MTIPNEQTQEIRSMASSASRTSIAILGGGTASLTTAFELTSIPDWEQKYEITVYQMGWRLGGKGASGRNADVSQRIEEHGLHVWGGFYQNAFTVMQRCYAELGRDPTAPLANWQDAFKPKSDVVWEEYVNDRWIHWQLTIPGNSNLPGDAAVAPSDWQCWNATLAFLQSHVASWMTANLHLSGSLETWVSDRLKSFEFWRHPSASVGDGTVPLHQSLDIASKVASGMPSSPSLHESDDHQFLIHLIQSFRNWMNSLIGDVLSLSDDARRIWILADLTMAGLIGSLTDGVLIHGWDVINDLNWVDWLAKHGATELSLRSAPVRGWHDYFFAYLQGDPNQPCIEAGTSMRQLIRLMFHSKGAIFWEMQSGMGDTVFGPLYQVLQRRGVKFKFFHRIDALHLSDDKKSIETIVVGQQATMNHAGEYEPLIDVKGLPCWPSQPLYEQITQGSELKEQHIDLESPWSPWKDINTFELKRGVDFDIVVIGTSLAPLTDIASELIAASPEWTRMMSAMKTTPTIAVQLWFDRDATGLGSIPKALMTGYTDPLQTWGDFSHLIQREDWAPDKTPGNLAYFCGPMLEPESIAPYSDHSFQDQQDERARIIGMQAIQQGSAHLFPNIVPPSTGITGIEWEQLTDLQDRQGWRRFNAQYWRANISPAERYVLAVPGSSQYRLQNGLSGFENVFVCGDWTYTGLAGSIEGAVMSGMFASRAISGSPAVVPGEVKDS